MSLTTSLLSWAGSTIKPDFVLGGGRFVTTPPKGMFFYTFPSVRVMILRHNSKTSEWLVPGFQRILPDPVGKMGTCRKRGWRKKNGLTSASIQLKFSGYMILIFYFHIDMQLKLIPTSD